MCPPNWTADTKSCLINGNGFYINEIENQPLTNLSNLTLTGTAGPSGDAIIFSTGNDNVYAAVDQPSKFNLNTWWRFAEFNVFGWAGFQEVNLGSNVTVFVQPKLGAGVRLCLGWYKPRGPVYGEQRARGDISGLSAGRKPGSDGISSEHQLPILI